MIPILLVVGEVLLLALAGGIAGGLFVLAVEAVMKKFAGKSIAVIGERATGKTTLAQFLSTGEIPEEYEQTLDEKRYTGRTIKLTDLNLKVTEINDVPGDSEYYKQWKSAVWNSEVVYYLARADKIVESEHTRARILRDVKHLCGWLEENPGKHLFFIGTHCDLIPEYVALTPANRGDYQDRFFKLNGMSEVALRLRDEDATMILGSLKPERAMQAVVHLSFQKVVAGDT
jgi:hypothetical protein